MIVAERDGVMVVLRLTWERKRGGEAELLYVLCAIYYDVRDMLLYVMNIRLCYAVCKLWHVEEFVWEGVGHAEHWSVNVYGHVFGGSRTVCRRLT